MVDRQAMPQLVLVEDDDIAQECFVRALEQADFRCSLHVAEDGHEALELLNSDRLIPSQPIVLILDLNMPEMNGHELLRRLRADDRFAFLPVFILTSSDHRSDVDQAWRQNVVGYVLKDDTTSFVAMLTAYLQISQWPTKLWTATEEHQTRDKSATTATSSVS